MTRDQAAPNPGAVRTLMLIVLLAAGTPAIAQEASPADGLLEKLNLKARLAPAPPFVADRSGQRGHGFIPAGRMGASRPVSPMTPAELAAATADLDATRERQQRRAGRVPAKVPDKPPAISTARSR